MLAKSLIRAVSPTRAIRAQKKQAQPFQILAGGMHENITCELVVLGVIILRNRES